MASGGSADAGRVAVTRSASAASLRAHTATVTSRQANPASSPARRKPSSRSRVAGTVYVGLWAHTTGLRGTMLAVAALAAALLALTPPLLHLSTHRDGNAQRSWTGSRHRQSAGCGVGQVGGQ